MLGVNGKLSMEQSRSLVCNNL